MATSLESRVDALSQLTPNLVASAPNPLAKAKGLTEGEAEELVAWLEQSGYHEIEVLHESEQCSVLWKS